MFLNLAVICIGALYALPNQSLTLVLSQSVSEGILPIPDQYHVKWSVTFDNLNQTVIVKNGKTALYQKTSDTPYQCYVYKGTPRDAFKKPEYYFTRLTEFAGKKVKEYANALNNRDYADFKKWLYVDVETGDRVGAFVMEMLSTGDWLETNEYVDIYSEGQPDESVFQPPVDIKCQDAGNLLESVKQNFQQFVMQH
ncbi:hypothetical protein MP228_005281 [Amoeboaphelidium protococcarum]|nr:hypothetical protein MP228_005281 [Amoeboaphelidium protococcarum]